MLTTIHDEVVTPYQSQALAGDHATDVILQDKCPADPFEHVTIVGDPVAIQWAVNALERPGAGRAGIRVRCAGPTGAVCIGRLEARRGRRIIATRAFRIAAGTTRVVRLRMGKARRVRALMPRPGGGVQVVSRPYRLR